MFDPLLQLRRRRMMGVPQVTGNIQPPDVGPDMMSPPVAAPQPMVMQPMQPEESGFGGLAQLGAERGMNALLKRMKGNDVEAGAAALAKTPILSKLFRR